MEVTVIATGSTGNCYRISDGQTALLLDAGVPIDRIRRGCGFRLSEVSACLVTHSHMDHCKAAPALCAMGVDVFMPRKEIKAARDLREARHSHRLHPLEKCPEYGDYLVISVGTFDIRPFAIKHDTPEPVGYLCASSVMGEKLLYFTDTHYLRNTFTGLTHIIGECNYDHDTLWEAVEVGETPAARVQRIFNTHMGLDGFLDMLSANDLSRLRQVYVCHMSSAHGSEAKIKEAVQRLTGAEVYIC